MEILLIKNAKYAFLLLFVSYERPCSAHVGNKRKYRGLLTGRDTILMDTFITHYHIDMKTHGMAFVEPVYGTCWSKSVTLIWQVHFNMVKANGTQLLQIF